jgi:hypothetical protein
MPPERPVQLAPNVCSSQTRGDPQDTRRRLDPRPITLVDREDGYSAESRILLHPSTAWFFQPSAGTVWWWTQGTHRGRQHRSTPGVTTGVPQAKGSGILSPQANVQNLGVHELSHRVTRFFVPQNDTFPWVVALYMTRSSCRRSHVETTATRSTQTASFGV